MKELGLPRREFLKKATAVAFAAPVIVSFALDGIAEADQCLPNQGIPNQTFPNQCFFPNQIGLSLMFLPPLDQSTDPCDPEVVNTGKNGRVVPVKVQLTTFDGTPLTDQDGVTVTIRVTRLTTPGDGTNDPIETYADAGSSSAGTDQFRFDARIPGWIYNLDTKALVLTTGVTYRIDVLVDGCQFSNVFAAFKPVK
jgi:hypothetical protein